MDDEMRALLVLHAVRRLLVLMRHSPYSHPCPPRIHVAIERRIAAANAELDAALALALACARRALTPEDAPPAP